MSYDLALVAGVFMFLGYMLRTIQGRAKGDKLDVFFALYLDATKAQQEEVHMLFPLPSRVLREYQIVKNLDHFVQNSLDDAIKLLENEA